MHKISIKLPILLLLASISTYSCSTLQEFANMQKPTVSVSDFDVTDFSLQDIELTFDMEVNNPNKVAITLANYDYDLQINNNTLIKGNQLANTEVRAGAKNIIKIPVRFEFSDLYNLFSSLKDEDETGFTFAANAYVDVPVLGQVKIPFSQSGTFPVLKLPKFELGSLELANLTLTKADFEINLNIENPNAFALNFNKLNYDLSLSGLSTLTGQTSEKTIVKRKSTSTIKLPLSVNILQLGINIKKLLNDDGNIDYSLTGNTVVGSSLPFFKPSTFEFDRNGSVPVIR